MLALVAEVLYTTSPTWTPWFIVFPLTSTVWRKPPCKPIEVSVSLLTVTAVETPSYLDLGPGMFIVSLGIIFKPAVKSLAVIIIIVRLFVLLIQENKELVLI